MIDPKFKDVKVGDWVFHKNFGWRKLDNISGMYSEYPLIVSGNSYNMDGKISKSDKYPTLLLHNPFDPHDKPPCEFKEGEVVMVKNRESGVWSLDIFRRYDYKLERPYVTLYNRYFFARKLNSVERGL